MKIFPALKSKWIFPIILVVITLAVPLYTSRYVLQVLLTVVTFVGLVGAWNIISGFTGYPFLGSVAFYGLGAYIFAIMQTGMPYIVAILLGGSLCFVIGFFLGMPFLKIRGAYFAIATYALSVLFANLILYYEQVVSKTTGRWVPTLGLNDLFILLFFISLVTLVVAYIIKKSRFGYGLLSIKGNEEVANVIGINTFRSKCLAFGICAFFTGIIGAAISMRGGYIDTTIVFAPIISFNVLVMGLFGGMGSIRGGILSAAIITVLFELFGTGGNPYPFLITLGVLLFIVIYFLPRGMESLLKRVKLKGSVTPALAPAPAQEPKARPSR